MSTFFGFLIGMAVVATAVWARSRYLGFPGQKPEDYSDAETSFDIREHLNGDILCEGVIFGPTGRISSRFVADMHATWDNDKGSVTEKFRYSSGETQDREWNLSVVSDGKFLATADDIIGAGKGTQVGSGVRLEYRIKLPEHAGGHVLDVIDWMYLVDNGTIMNRSQFRKFGIKVAELVATMRPVEQSDERREAA